MFKASARRIRRTIANAALLVAACLTFAHPITQAQSQVRRVDDEMLRNAAATGDDWLNYGLDPGEKRYSPLTQIDATNVSRLQQVWAFDIPGGTVNPPGGGNQEATLLASNGVLYGITNGLTWQQAGHLASHAAARVVAQMGARLHKKFTPQEIKDLLR